MLITFGFLGFAFYELSDGADYKPHANSIQARAGQTDPVSVAELEPVEAPSIADLATSASEAAPAERLGITLAFVAVTRTVLGSICAETSVSSTRTDARVIPRRSAGAASDADV
ncbi:MAG: hypothetical protein AAFN80_08665, partial [Pseudomonadota bacterium]